MTEWEALLRLVLAAVAGAFVGLDREIRHKPAGLRTNAIVATGAAMFTIVGILAFGEGDPASRVAAQIVTGVGFLGAGAIIQQRAGVEGLTTAAGIWGAAAVGMAFGAGLYILGIGGAILLMILLTVIGVAEGYFKHRE
jgi:putative Mg2+ transporter-C (MgtC) family protein